MSVETSVPLRHYSILTIGASGLTGRELIKSCSQNHSSPKVHAYFRDPSYYTSKLPQEFYKRCEGVHVGDATNQKELGRDLTIAEPDLVVVWVGGDDPLVRTESAKALVECLSANVSTRVILVSSVGARDSKINFGLGVGTAMQLKKKSILKDHSGQEEALLSSAPHDRTLVVRATTLTIGKAMGKVKEFTDQQRCSSTSIDRSDVAVYVSNMALDGGACEGLVNVTGVGWL